jgi:hypothetical protein
LLPVSGIHADLAQQYRVARNMVAKALRRSAARRRDDQVQLGAVMASRSS